MINRPLIFNGVFSGDLPELANYIIKYLRYDYKSVIDFCVRLHFLYFGKILFLLYTLRKMSL